MTTRPDAGPGAPGGDASGSLLTLHRLSRGYRVLFSGVLLFIVAGFGAGLARQHLRSGVTPEAIADWHLGNRGERDVDQLLFRAGPAEVLDRVWRRSLGIVIPLIVLLALWFRASVSARARAGATALLTGLALVDVASPALVRYVATGSPVTAWAAWLGQVGLPVAALGVASVCLWQMWARREAGPRFRDRVEAGA